MSSLVRRNRQPQIDPESVSVSSTESKRKQNSVTTILVRLLTNIAKIVRSVFLAAFCFWMIVLVRNRKKIFGDRNTIRRMIGSDIFLQVSFNSTIKSKESETIITSLGVHKATVSVTSDCKNPRIWLRLVGDSLIPIPLIPSGPGSLSGTFEIPIEGRYTLDARWYGCGESDVDHSYTGLNSPLEFVAQGQREPLPSSSSGFAQVWMASSKFSIDSETPPSPYVWMTTDPAVSPGATSLLPASSSLGSSLVAREVTPVSDGFKALSNYEIVCFIGSDSAAAIREAFLSLRPHIANYQRPFKFHYRKVTDFQHPDQDWAEDDAIRFRKCKIVIVSVDNLDEPVSQTEYKSQVKTFLGHIVKALNDDTFPIWMATVNHPPMAAPTMCHSPEERNNTLHHPCNEALLQLFQESSFPSRVHLMDNTDLSLPMFDAHVNDIVAVIALRVFSIFGLQVDAWREKGQKGTVDGLMRGKDLEPNFELVPYDWS